MTMIARSTHQKTTNVTTAISTSSLRGNRTISFSANDILTYKTSSISVQVNSDGRDLINKNATDKSKNFRAKTATTQQPVTKKVESSPGDVGSNYSNIINDTNTTISNPDDYIFIKDDKLTWVPAIVLSIDTEESNTARVRVPIYEDEQSIQVMLQNSNHSNPTGWKEINIDLDEYPGKAPPLQSISVPDGEFSYPDMVDFIHLNEPGILYNIKARHKAMKPYTRCGDMIVSVNPFQWIPKLYSEQNRFFYSKQLVWTNCDTDPRRGVEPHVYEVSALAYKGLAFDDEDQSILITGESGSGKTETAKIIMDHIASIQRGPVHQEECITDNTKANSIETTKSNDNNKTVDENQFYSPIVQRILESNPLLEAFGNAKTRRNDNSSRFGKYTQLQFDKGDPELREYHLKSKALCVLAGSKCEVYLLEKNRVCSHAHGERGYHIFYQLLATDESRQELIWPGMVGKNHEDYKYIGPTATRKIDGQTDEAKFLETMKALNDIGIRGNRYITLMRAICIVLQLGNITFDACPNDEDRALITSPEPFAALADLMGIGQEDLTQGLTERVMTTRGETFKVKLKASASKDACDAFAKEIYSKTFLWLVRAINDATCAELNYSQVDREQYDDPNDMDFGIIGLLDIFGFESFDHNHFEQLCINYANEKLQQKAINDIFRETKREYDREGIPLTEIEFADNEKVLNLIEGRLGLLDLLNDECYKPKGCGEIFLKNALQTHAGSSYLLPPKRGVRNKFSIVHYAGIVEYEADNFVQGNQDSLPQDLIECAKKSSNEIIAVHLCNDKSTNPICNDKEDNIAFGKTAQITNLCTSVSTVATLGVKSGGASNIIPTHARQRSFGAPKQPPKTPTQIVGKKTFQGIGTPSHGSELNGAPCQQGNIQSLSLEQADVLSADVLPRATQSDLLNDQITDLGDCSNENDKCGQGTGVLNVVVTSESSEIAKSSSPDTTAAKPNEKNTARTKKKKVVKKVIKVRAAVPLKRSNSGLIQPTVWSKYQQQLTELMEMLNETKSRYVRCIKPNTLKKPLYMEQSSTVEQLRCSGIVSTVCLSRATFQNSIPNGVLRFRYQNIWNREKYPAVEMVDSASNVSISEAKFKSECTALLACAFQAYKPKDRQHGTPYVVGKTRTYFRRGAMEYLESLRVLEMDTLAISIQRRMRGVIARTRMAAIRNNTPRIQRWYRALLAKRKLNNLVRKNRYQKARNMFKSSAPTFIVKGSAFR